MSNLQIQRQIVRSGYDRKTCWTHARPGFIPGEPPIGVITTHALRLTGEDVFYAVHDLRSDDGGQTWSEPVCHDESLGRIPVAGGLEDGVCDLTPTWHAASGTLLATGHTIRYLNDNLHPHPRARSTVYTTYNPADRSWAHWQQLALPDEPKFFCEGAGSTQRLDLPNGEILLPTYAVVPGTGDGVFGYQAMATVLRCGFDGQTMTYLEHGTELTVPEGRGFTEPSITYAAGRYWLTLRNNETGYVATGNDGLHYHEPVPWIFDDGSDLGNYNTQQHWVTHGDELYLVYTRRGANNDHVFRHRAPLFLAQVDTDRACVIRETERVIVPERGARLGNFGIARVSEDETWVVVSEWMQTTPPDPFDCRVCESHGSDNAIFLVRLRFH